MNKKVTKKLQRFIDSISVIGESTIPDDDGKIYYSIVDGSYLTRVGMENDLDYLLKNGITEQIQDGYGEPRTACIGFNPIEQKWYGWSHRAIFGFGIGSECKPGDIHFQPSNKEEFKQGCLSFWGDNEYSKGDEKLIFTKGLNHYEKEVDGVLLTFTYNDKVPNEKSRGTEYRHFEGFPKKWGKGEWTAKTLEEAKQMAIDFAKDVS